MLLVEIVERDKMPLPVNLAEIFENCLLPMAMATAMAS
jgi:hypothetical protein